MFKPLSWNSIIIQRNSKPPQINILAIDFPKLDTKCTLVYLI